MTDPRSWYHTTGADQVDNERAEDIRDRIYHCDQDGGLVHYDGWAFTCANCGKHS